MQDFAVTLFSFALMCVAIGVMLRKAGFSLWWLLLFPLFPILVSIIAFLRWPILDEIARLRLLAGEATQSDIDAVMRRAVKAEHLGQSELALRLFQLLAERGIDAEAVRYAEQSIERLRTALQESRPSGNPYASPST